VSKTNSLADVLLEELKAIHPNSFYEEAIRDANDNPPFPHIVFELSEVSESDGKTQLQFEVNVLNYGKKRSIVENLADQVQEYFHKLYYHDDNIQFAAYKLSRQPVKEDDKAVIKRRLLFEVQLHEMRGE